MTTYTNNISLTGLRVLNTRPAEQGRLLSNAITHAGGIALACPALAIAPTKPDWFNLLPSLDSVKQAIFTSANAVTYAFNIFKHNNLLWPLHIQVTAVGKSTARQLAQYGITVTNVPTQADSEHLLALPSLQHVKQELILLFKGEGGRLLIPSVLAARGAELIELCVYQRIKPQINHEQLQAWWHNKAVDIILFTSYEAMQNIFTMFGESAHSWLRNLPCLVISQRLADAASSLGMQKIIRCSPETILDTLDQFNKGFTHE
ncbi:uroporphyrinogen III methylase [Legionella beliardensis]|uniref:Uroporphyrinogen-III synthase n=1 Tax=Legionella beliardensis TaxID=91822 RepID=A0A378IC59_9GAMM|nr:uroporphyrinogen-III synthase [Legionella beliardensis]STX29884.1 uroporphyrinogen III methylase [Legionella beliardensis]